ncbi:hypothetical protein AZE42_10883 [Rhizopogon vesiculosus]|uniref:Uncharacterized protein n=1 Tax=Rhizopogon vesiculosus TaxID=180088 RepID=A0A1J8QKJ6_9AGAM|nr:hypothetical protein AZE42_10883 [Rhizopogon vesiculosus]
MDATAKTSDSLDITNIIRISTNLQVELEHANFAIASVLLVPPPCTLVIPPMHRSCYLGALFVKVFTCRNGQQAITFAL